ncbi:MAG: hypothetical protein ACREPM_09535 [Gemmatimonadaceae bacterium]
MAEIDGLLDADAKAGSEEYDRLRFLSVLVEAYKDEHDQIDETGTPQSVVAFMLDQAGMTRADPAPWMGGERSRRRTRAGLFSVPR